MNIGNRLYELRKKKNISQEEAAEKLGVTRQTISKWETGESKPDFDKIVPLCELYEISTEELLKGEKGENNTKGIEDVNTNDRKRKTAFVISLSVFLYFIAVIWIIIAEPLDRINENTMVGIFLLICAIATVILIFHFVSLPKNKQENNLMVKKQKYQKYDNLISLIFTAIYLLISFLTMAWHITWLIWIVYAIVTEIVHILLEMKEDKDEK